MAVRQYKPTSTARRFQSVVDFSDLSKKAPERSLLAPHRESGGRNNRGRITLCDIAAADINADIALLIFGVKKMELQQRSLRLNMTQIALLTLHSFITLMGRNVTFFPLWDYRLETA